MPRERHYWLFKSEPECFSIQDLARSPDQTTFWDGVRNYQARNFLRDQIKLGDEVLYYHSNSDPNVVAGRAVVVREGYPDHTAWEPGSDHFDPQASPINPIWQMVDIKLAEIFVEPIALESLRDVPALKEMELLRRGSRLSVQPVRKSEFETIVKLAHAKPAAGMSATAEPVATKKGTAKGKTTKRGVKRPTIAKLKKSTVKSRRA